MNDQERRDEEARMQAERMAVVDASRVLVESSRILRGEAARLVDELDLEAERALGAEATTGDTGPPPPIPVAAVPMDAAAIDAARRELHAAVDAVADGAEKIKKHLGAGASR